MTAIDIVLVLMLLTSSETVIYRKLVFFVSE